jgi:hypothetical protein
LTAGNTLAADAKLGAAEEALAAEGALLGKANDSRLETPLAKNS